MTPTIDVPNEKLSMLTKGKAVKLVEELVHIDAKMSDISLDIVLFSSEIDTADGGVDGKVNGSDKKSTMGTIKKGLTCYQIKSGRQRPIPNTIRRILRTNGGKGPLRPGIKNCFDENGTLVLVFMGVDPPAQQIDKIVKHPKEYLPEYKNPRLEIWVQANLRQFLKSHLRLSLKILGIGDGLFCSYQDWASQEYMRTSISLGSTQRDFMYRLKMKLSRTSTEHIRVTGEPGIGKTRLVLEALRTEFSDLCWYIDNPRKFLESDLFRYITTRDDKSLIILVVDECVESEMVEIWNKIKDMPQIRLITIYNESGTIMHDMVNFEVPPLEDKQIIEILKSYIPPHIADIWYKECRPSPRAAHVIGRNLRSSTDDILQPPSNMRVWDRYIASGVELDSTEFKERKKILLWISLFKRFGERELYTDEYKIIEKVFKDKIEISPAILSQTITRLKRMKILQGSALLYITPKVLHVWLWREWHRAYHTELFPLDEIASSAKPKGASDNVLVWYMDMLRYANDMSSVRSITDNIFKHGGFADKHDLLSSHAGANLFYSASKADPEKAVDYIYRHIISMDKDRLLNFNVGRRQAAMALADAATNRGLFERSTRLLLMLAGAEGGQGFSDIAHLFISLFLPASGPVGRIEMPPSGRLPLLKAAFDVEDAECHLLGIRACEAALQMPDFIGDVDEDEAWQRSKPWTSKHRSEYTEYYAGVLRIIREYLGHLEESERSKMVEVVLSRARALLRIPELHGAVLSLLDIIYTRQYANSEQIIETISDCLMYERDNMLLDLRKNLELLRDRVTGNSYSALLKRYVSMKIRSDFLDEDNIRQEAVAELAEQSLDIKRLEPELDWLVTDEAAYGYEFGQALGKLDGGVLFAHIHDAQRRHETSSGTFLGGYLRAVFLRNVKEWEYMLDLLVKNSDLYKLVPALTSMSGMTDRAAIRVRDLVKAGLDPMVLSNFVHGVLDKNISEERFEEWLQLLADGNSETYEIALNLYYKYYVRNNRRIPDSVRGLLFPDDDGLGIQCVSINSSHSWFGILISFIKQNPSEIAMVGITLHAVMNTSYMASSLHYELLPVLAIATDLDPVKTWEIITDFIDSAKNKSNAYWNVKSLLSMSNVDFVDKISLEVIFNWIDNDKEKRAPFVAYLLPNSINTAIKLAAKYGKIKSVTSYLINNLNSEMITGSMLNHYKTKIKLVDSLIEKENDTAALEFLQRYKKDLMGNI